ncbi:MAG: arylsulfotransferase family protein [Rhodobacteraceae bacterium]|nr:arylsulfotransferase family protein [Paracoccaceae bacterium]
MKTLLKYWLLVLVVYLLGAGSVMFSIWPAPALLDLYLYVFDNRWQTQSVAERVRSDLDITPYRLLSRDGGGAAHGAEFRDLAVPGLRERRQLPQLALSADREPRLTFIYGVFDFTDGLHGAILIDEGGKVVHRWTLAEDPSQLQSQPNSRLYPHGVQVEPDGSVVFVFDLGTAISKVDACGRYLWSRADGRDYNHVLSRAADGSLWTIAGAPNSFDRIDPASGDILQSIAMRDLIAANPDLGIFTARSDHSAQGRKWLGDPFHGNDIEELLPGMAAAFPMFAPGDLMASFRTLNLIFVFDPVTLKVKWWRQGATQQQHDPDFLPDGGIMIYDNRWDNPPSKITRIDPATNIVTTLLDGADHDFFSADRGKAQWLDGALLVTSSRQGRVFEVDRSGRVTFDFVNLYDDGEGLRGLVSEAIALPPDYFHDLPDCH